MSEQNLTKEEIQALWANRCSKNFVEIANALNDVLSDFPGAAETAHFLRVSASALTLYGIAKGVPQNCQMPNNLSNISIN